MSGRSSLSGGIFEAPFHSFTYDHVIASKLFLRQDERSECTDKEGMVSLAALLFIIHEPCNKRCKIVTSEPIKHCFAGFLENNHYDLLLTKVFL